MLTDKMKQALIIAGFGLLAVVAVAGWTRNPSAGASPNYLQAPAGFSSQPLTADNRAVYGQQPYGQQPQVYSQLPQTVQGAGYAGAPVNCVEPLYVQNAAYAPPQAAPQYRTYSRPRVIRTYVREERGGDYVVRKRGRSTGKSVAIVGGSAGVGAAIGALAGGGKGAAIGALGGGAAGFIYDRLTHNR
jgi:hypothetical protein